MVPPRGRGGRGLQETVWALPVPGGHPVRLGQGRAGSTHPGHAKEQRHLMPAAPRELQARHGSLPSSSAKED